MISSAIGVIAMAGAISVFSTSVKSNGDNLKRIRLNQELRAIMDVMVRDIRRAGYWSIADGTTPNPFSTLNVSGDEKCITYRYDFATVPPAVPDPLDNANNFGFKFHNNGVKYRTNSATCGTNNNWVFISDPNAVKVTSLNFNLTTTCANLSAKIDTDCIASSPAADDVLSYMYMLEITLNGELTSDSNVTYSLTDSVSIRNAVPLVN